MVVNFQDIRILCLTLDQKYKEQRFTSQDPTSLVIEGVMK